MSQSTAIAKMLTASINGSTSTMQKRMITAFFTVQPSMGRGAEMTDRNRWFQTASDEEQGSFCDTTSEIHYQNVSRSEALELEEETMRRGEGVVSVEAPSDSSQSDSQRYNTFDSDIDGQGYDHPSKYAPGR
jgi:hypothetical protein